MATNGFIPGTMVLGIQNESPRGTEAVITYDLDFYEAAPISPSREITTQGKLAGRKSKAAH